MNEVYTVEPTQAIAFTNEAELHFQRYVQNNGAIGIRLRVEPSGCAGFSFVWDLVHEYDPQQEPYLYDQDGFIFFVDSLSFPFLIGSIIELETVGPGGQVVKVVSPKQVSACGCGESVQFNND